MMLSNFEYNFSQNLEQKVQSDRNIHDTCMFLLGSETYRYQGRLGDVLIASKLPITMFIPYKGTDSKQSKKKQHKITLDMHKFKEFVYLHSVDIDIRN